MLQFTHNPRRMVVNFLRKRIVPAAGAALGNWL